MSLSKRMLSLLMVLISICLICSVSTAETIEEKSIRYIDTMSKHLPEGVSLEPFRDDYYAKLSSTDYSGFLQLKDTLHYNDSFAYLIVQMNENYFWPSIILSVTKDNTLYISIGDNRYALVGYKSDLNGVCDIGKTGMYIIQKILETEEEVVVTVKLKQERTSVLSKQNIEYLRKWYQDCCDSGILSTEFYLSVAEEEDFDSGRIIIEFD